MLLNSNISFSPIIFVDSGTMFCIFSTVEHTMRGHVVGSIALDLKAP
ncbi:hypothetical protein OESDEN_07932 [Oesophagostomum dentatum]|uniref:Uncharacterized protein n=1 Tax=Oesophagostomum dentatum TaxID=61180 RepID=A0A0B1T7U3_OESDE|nr:hypothetical protein OESDEN_07932 [Oesophagostomum dentatum]